MKVEIYHKILSLIGEIIEGTEFEGHVYSVGGCERDRHLGADTIKDIDVVVDLVDGGIRFAKWLEANGLTSGKTVLYENFGTAMFKLKEFPDEEIESVHTRREVYRNRNSRNPETSFGTIGDDCMRRDFTINSLYHNISTGEDLDPTGRGLKDLEREIIDTCSSPDEIFTEDPLRIMRAARFSSKLGFTIDRKVFDAMKNSVDRLKIVSQERITDEFNKILMSGHPYIGLSYLGDIGFFDTVTPYLFRYENGEKNTVAELGAIESVMAIVDNYDYGIETLLGAFVQNWYCDNKQRNEFLRKFKYPNNVIDKVNFYATNAFPLELACNFKLESKIREIAYRCKTLGDFNNIVSIAKSFPRLKDGLPVFDFIDKIDAEEMIGYKLPVNGDDVMEICGVKPGKLIKDILDQLLELVFKNPKITRDECVCLLKNFKHAK